MMRRMTDIADLRGLFSGRLLTEAAEMAPFLVDWRKQWRGRALAVAQPDSPNDVAAIVGWCAGHNIPIVPQGGNTGMSGGATPDPGGTAVLLSLVRLNQVRSIDAVNNTITVDAGCILQNVQDAALAADRLFPLSLAAEGSCTIGGNLATNAGGTAVLRYGSARDLCLGLEVVTPKGDLWDGLRGLRKDNSGYDLRDLFIGSEGTLGIITGAVLKLLPKPAARAVAFVAVVSPRQAIAFFSESRRRFDTAITAFELLSDVCLELVLAHSGGARSPFASRASWYVLIEVADLASEAEARAKLEELLGKGFDQGLIVDAVIATSLAQDRALRALRENISEAHAATGTTIKHDIALPISRIADFLDEANAAIAARWPDIRFVTFGHLGDGNLHYNFSPPAGDGPHAFGEIQCAINRLVHDLVIEHGGSISAEHGLGVLRRDEAARYKSPVEIGLMRAIKDALDPAGIMNPGKLLS
jgi:FAD/FMN-containing dehydrogenase